MMSIIMGLITIALGVAGMVMKWFGGEVTGLQMFVRALVAIVPALLIVSGLIAIIAGISNMKDRNVETAGGAAEASPEPENTGGEENKA